MRFSLQPENRYRHTTARICSGGGSYALREESREEPVVEQQKPQGQDEVIQEGIIAGQDDADLSGKLWREED